MVTLMSASALPLTTWLFGAFWIAVGSTLPLLVLGVFMIWIFPVTTAQRIVIGFVSLYAFVALGGTWLVMSVLSNGTGAGQGILAYLAALMQLSVTFLFARTVMALVNGKYDPVWFERLYHRLSARYFGWNDPYETPVSRTRGHDVNDETDGIDETDHVPAYTPALARAHVAYETETFAPMAAAAAPIRPASAAARSGRHAA